MIRRECELPIEEYISRFREEERVLEACKSCPRYSTTWACPPFSYDVTEFLKSYSTIRIITYSFTLDKEDCSFESILPKRDKLNDRILKLEKKLNGRACSFAGSCDLCKKCNRVDDRPCVFPKLMRSPLEAYGFNINRTLEELFGISLKWDTGNNQNKKVTLVGAVLYNLHGN